MGPVDETWTKKDLQAECKRRGMTGYSRFNKASLLRALETGGNRSRFQHVMRALRLVLVCTAVQRALFVEENVKCGGEFRGGRFLREFASTE